MVSTSCLVRIVCSAMHTLTHSSRQMCIITEWLQRAAHINSHTDTQIDTHTHTLSDSPTSIHAHRPMLIGLNTDSPTDSSHTHLCKSSQTHSHILTHSHTCMHTHADILLSPLHPVLLPYPLTSRSANTLLSLFKTSVCTLSSAWNPFLSACHLDGSQSFFISWFKSHFLLTPSIVP
jgi:hypothetical protein